MIVTVKFKTPDVLQYALEDLNEDEREEAERFIKKYVYWSEYVDLEFDTEKETVKVLRCS